VKVEEDHKKPELIPYFWKNCFLLQTYEYFYIYILYNDCYRIKNFAVKIFYIIKHFAVYSFEYETVICLTVINVAGNR